MKHPQLLKLIALGACLSGTSVMAAEEVTNLNVNAFVADSCTVIAGTALSFATVDTSSDASQVTPGVITVVCTSSRTGMTVSLGSGGQASSGVRYMSDGGSNTIPYKLHSDIAHANEVAIDGNVFSGNAAPAIPVIIPVYGQIPAGNYATGSYSDSIVVTLTH
ncbi:spore coat U domain-containing protein [Rhodobacteraceae bacterium D3-12]|nr:spore coat U domain-containing protein [Rhodobacteraceae bacterium D3-12]